MKCPHCHQQHADTAQFCPVTGQPLTPPVSICPNCRKEVAPNARFCPYCRYPLAQGTPPPSRSSKKTVWIALIGIAALAILAGGYYLMTRSPFTPVPEATAIQELVNLVQSPAPAVITNTPTLPAASPTVPPTNTALPPPPAPLPTPVGALTSRLAPNGLWAAYEMDTGLIKVIGAEQAWDLDFNDYGDSGYLVPGIWSPDGKYLYFAGRGYIDGGLFLGPFGLYRLRLEDGQVEEIISGFMFTYAISPDGGQLAYITFTEAQSTFTIRDLHTGEEKAIPLESDFAQAGYPLWSPDSNSVVATMGEGGVGEEMRSALVLVDVTTGNQQLLIDNSPGMVYAQEWSPQNQILVSDRGRSLGWYDADTGELVAPPPTTTPGAIQPTAVAPSPTATETSSSQTSTNPVDGAGLVFIPAGEFYMGSDSSYDPYFWGAESPIHQVYLDDYWIYRTEVTNAMYERCASEQACPKPDTTRSSTRSDYYGNPQYADYPVIFVSWGDASAYCKWANGSLPTEAQWEKAARGTDDRLFPWGSMPPTGQQANYCDQSCTESWRDGTHNDGSGDTAPVGSYPAGASPYGVLDLAGNVWEWVFDWFATTYYKNTPDQNPRGPASGERHVIRGGSWYNAVDGIRLVARASKRPDANLESLGFRCVVNEP